MASLGASVVKKPNDLLAAARRELAKERAKRRKTAGSDEEEEKDGDEKSSFVFKNLDASNMRKLAGRDVKKRRFDKLDFSDPVFRLQNISGLTVLIKDCLVILNLSHNQLRSIQEVNEFPNMNILNASHNKITFANLNLQLLTELDLSHNRLVSIPPLVDLPNLTTLMVRGNQIRGKWNELTLCKNFKTLDIAANSFDFGPRAFKQGLKKLSTLPNLTSLAIGDSPFTALITEYTYYAIKMLPTLLTLDGETVSKEFRASVAKRDLTDLDEMEEEIQRRRREEAQKRKIRTTLDGNEAEKLQQYLTEGYIPTVKQLIELVEETYTKPEESVVMGSALAFAIDKIIFRKEEQSDMFNDLRSKDDDADDAGTFEDRKDESVIELIEKLCVLMERHHELRNNVCRILAKLCLVHEAGISLRCLAALTSLMTADHEMRDVIRDYLDELVLPLIRDMLISGHAVESFIQGVTKVAEDPSLVGGLSALIPIYHGFFLRKEPLPDSVLVLLACTACHNGNTDEMQSRNITKGVCDLLQAEESFIMLSATKKLNRYLNTLKFIRETAQRHVNVIKDYEEKKVHTVILRTLREFMKLPLESLTVENYQFMSSLVDTVEVLCERSRTIRKHVIGAGKFVSVLLFLANTENQDPLLLSSVFRAVLGCLRREGSKSQRLLVAGLSGVIPLLEYLGGKSYGGVCRLAERHGDGAFTEGKPRTLTTLLNPVVHKLLVAVLKIVSFFSLKSGQSKLCTQVAIWLNSAKRESFTFKCMDVPNEEVKFAAIECLSTVPLDQLDQDDIALIVKHVAPLSVLGGGATEKLLAAKMKVMSRLIIDESHAGEAFRELFGKQAIESVYEILARNVERDLRKNELETAEKEFLTKSCMSLLNHVTVSATLRPFMRTYKIGAFFQRILRIEELWLDMDHPIPIECTWSGRHCEWLLNCFMGDTALDPSRPIALRVLRRLGDVLEGVFEPCLRVAHAEEERKKKLAEKQEAQRSNTLGTVSSMLNALRGKNKPSESSPNGEVGSFLDSANDDEEDEEEEISADKQHVQGDVYTFDDLPSYPDMCRLEMQPFDMSEALLQQETVELRTDRLQQHVTFLSFKGMDRLCIFLLPLLNVPSTFDERRFGELVPPSDILKAIEQVISANDINEFFEDDPLIEESSRTYFPQQTVKVRDAGQELLMQRFQEFNGLEVVEEDLLMGDECIAFLDHSVNHERSNIDKELRDRKHAMISAVFRCCHSLLYRATQLETQALAVAQLKRAETLRMLTNLAASTRWQFGSLADKYVKVVKFAVELEARKLSSSSQLFPVFDTIALGICDILETLKATVSFRVWNPQPMKAEDESLCAEIASLCRKMCEHAKYIELPGGVQSSRAVRQKVMEYTLRRWFSWDGLKVLISLIYYDTQVNRSFTEFDSIAGGTDSQSRRDQIRPDVSFLLACYLNYCPNSRYKLLEALNQSETFGHLPLRATYLRDLLLQARHVQYADMLEFALHDRGLIPTGTQERLVHLCYVQVVQDKGLLEWRLLMLTNVAFYVLRDPMGEQYDPAGVAKVALEVRGVYSKVRSLCRCLGSERIAFCAELVRRNPKLKTDQNKIECFQMITKSSFICNEIITHFVQLASVSPSFPLPVVDDPTTFKSFKRKSGSFEVLLYTTCYLLDRRLPQPLPERHISVLTPTYWYLGTEQLQHWFNEPLQDVLSTMKEEAATKKLAADSSNGKGNGKGNGKENPKGAALNEGAKKQKSRQKIREENEAVDQLLTVRAEETLESLCEVSLGGKEDPTLKLKFGRKEYILYFMDDWVRERWRTALAHVLKEKIASFERVYFAKGT